jgi:alcohol dehydrogenase
VGQGRAAAVETAVSGPAARAGWAAEVGGIRLLFGAGSLGQLGLVAGELSARRALVVTDPGVRAAGHAARGAEALIGAGVAVEIFDRVGENPTTADVEAGAEAARRFSPDLLVGLGGGSAMDCAKGVNFLATQGGRLEEFWGFGKAREPMLPSVGVPTTAGTGSEAQSYALIAQAAPEPGMLHGRKMACGDRQARFQVVILDPELLASAPRRAAGAAALDALSHAVESLVTTRRNPVSALYSREAWRLLEGALEAFVAAPADAEAAGRMLLGAHLAGAAIEASMLGAAHAAANPLTAAFGVAHGVAVALMLPHVVRFNGGAAAELYSQLAPGESARAAPSGPALAAAEALALRIEELRQAAGLPARLSQAGVDGARLPEMARLATREWTGTFNPRPLTEGDFKALYEAAY